MTTNEFDELKENHHDLCVFADEIAIGLNDVLTSLLGDHADWAENVGSTELPQELELLGLSAEIIQRLWILREGANGICASNNY